MLTGNYVLDHGDEIFLPRLHWRIDGLRPCQVSNENLKSKNVYFLIQLYQFGKTLHEYTQKYNASYSYWKDDISVKVAAYLYIGGL